MAELELEFWPTGLVPGGGDPFCPGRCPWCKVVRPCPDLHEPQFSPLQSGNINRSNSCPHRLGRNHKRTRGMVSMLLESLGPSCPCPVSFLQPAGGGSLQAVMWDMGQLRPGEQAASMWPAPAQLHGARHFTQHLLHKGPARGSRSNRAARVSRLALPVAS